MSEIVAATASELLQAVASTPGQAAGQSTEAWLADQLFKKVVEETTPGYQPPVYKWNVDPAAEEAFSKIVDQSGAEGAWQAWKDSGGNVSPGGNAAPSPSVKVAPETAIKKAGAGAASAGGLLSMSLPTWVAAAAPLLGVAVGFGLYELSPEMWTKISQKLLPFCYDGTQVMPVVTDEDGNTYIDKEAVEALKELFEEEGIGSGYIDDSDVDKSVLNQPDYPYLLYKYGDITFADEHGEHVTTITGAPNFFFYGNDQRYPSFTAVGDQPFTVKRFINGELKNSYPSHPVTKDGQTYHVTNIPYGTYQNRTTTFRASDLGARTDNTLWDVGYLTYNGIPATMPDGFTEWTGDKVSLPDLPITEVYTDPEDSTKTKDFIPVALPVDPGVSLDPDDNPDPTVNAEPEKQIEPYINPDTDTEELPDGSIIPDKDTDAPIPNPIPEDDPKPDPEADPTQPEDEPPGDDDPPSKLVDILPDVDPGDELPIPDNPTLPGPSGGGGDGGVGGLVSVYNPTYSELQAFSQWLWVTYADATIDKIWNNPFDGIISLHEFYATPDKGPRKYIKSGFLVSPVDSITIPKRYTEINCGTAIFPEFYGNYLDYSPYSKALCYLPFIGIVELNVDDIVGHAVNITYHVDSYSGACIALLQCTNDKSNGVLYQFSGNCSVQMPIAGGTQAAIKAAQLTAGAYQNAYHIAGLAGLAGGIASGIGSLLSLNLGGVLSGAVNGIGSYMTNQAQGQAAAVSQTVSAKSSVQHSGQFGESFGAMGNKKPYMILKRPMQVRVPNYEAEYGYPAHKYVKIGSCTGYIRCRGVHVLSARATDAEKHLIEQALTEGVYVT